MRRSWHLPHKMAPGVLEDGGTVVRHTDPAAWSVVHGMLRSSLPAGDASLTLRIERHNRMGFPSAIGVGPTDISASATVGLVDCSTAFSISRQHSGDVFADGTRAGWGVVPPTAEGSIVTLRWRGAFREIWLEINGKNVGQPIRVTGRCEVCFTVSLSHGSAMRIVKVEGLADEVALTLHAAEPSPDGLVPLEVTAMDGSVVATQEVQPSATVHDLRTLLQKVLVEDAVRLMLPDGRVLDDDQHCPLEMEVAESVAADLV